MENEERMKIIQGLFGDIISKAIKVLSKYTRKWMNTVICKQRRKMILTK